MPLALWCTQPVGLMPVQLHEVKLSWTTTGTNLALHTERT